MSSNKSRTEALNARAEALIINGDALIAQAHDICVLAEHAKGAVGYQTGCMKGEAFIDTVTAEQARPKMTEGGFAAKALAAKQRQEPAQR